VEKGERRRGSDKYFEEVNIEVCGVVAHFVRCLTLKENFVIPSLLTPLSSFCFLIVSYHSEACLILSKYIVNIVSPLLFPSSVLYVISLFSYSLSLLSSMYLVAVVW
jgi:hypothetical protein